MTKDGQILLCDDCELHAIAGKTKKTIAVLDEVRVGQNDRCHRCGKAPS